MSRTADPARPFAAATLRRAEYIARHYRLILEQDEQVGYVGHALELPAVMADGKTPNQCVKALREAVVTTIATMLEQGRTPPTPAAERRRTAQINIRLSDEEKLILEDAARRAGFRGVSDYIRTTTLTRAQ